MKIRHQVVVFDAADLAAESTFWAGVLGGSVDAEDQWHVVLVDGAPRVGVQLAPDHVAPQWPEGGPPQQIHLDLWVDDQAAANDAVMSLGATLLRSAAGGETADDFQVVRRPGRSPVLSVLGETHRRMMIGAVSDSASLGPPLADGTGGSGREQVALLTTIVGCPRLRGASVGRSGGLRSIGIDDLVDDRTVLVEATSSVPRVWLQKVREPKQVKNRFHLDPYAEAEEAEVTRRCGLG